MELIIGHKYVPHAKTDGVRFSKSDWVLFNIAETQGFLYYKGVFNSKYVFSISLDGNGEYYSKFDVTEYKENNKIIFETW